MTQLIGVDFGTTNSVIAVLEPDGGVRTTEAGLTLDAFRTVLCFWNEVVHRKEFLRHAAGPQAIEAYLNDPLDSRLIMSMKTYLAQRSFKKTNVFGSSFTLEAIVALFLRELLGSELDSAHIVAGRPVRFAGDSADDDFGEARLRASFAQAGFLSVDIALEPEAAGYRFARSLDRPATVLIGDFGGGTSDFSVLRFNPGCALEFLGHGGVGLAGDTFDYRIIDNVVSPLLGKGDVYPFMGKLLPVPAGYFAAFARWHRLSMMRTPRILREIEEVARASVEPSRLRRLVRLIEDEAGYQLYKTVSEVKAELSQARQATLRFAHNDFVVERTITRDEFDSWIEADLRRVGDTIDHVLERAGVERTAIDRVFLTGGTSFVPAVRRLFVDRFGEEIISTGGEFVSVAEGLALIGRDRLLQSTSVAL